MADISVRMDGQWCLGTFREFSMHSHDHAFTGLNPRQREGLMHLDRRGMMKVSMAGLAGLSLPALLADRAPAAQTGRQLSSRMSVSE